MNLSEVNLELDGLEELMEDLTKAIKKYPDLAERRLRQVSNNFRRDVVAEEIRVIKDDNIVKKNKLTTRQGFKLSRTKGYNENMEVDFSAKGAHFHLVENGHHQVTKDGRTTGWVPGNNVVKKMRKNYADHVTPFEMDKLLKEITKVCDLDD